MSAVMPNCRSTLARKKFVPNSTLPDATPTIADEMRRLLRGVAHDDTQQIRDGWRGVIAAGALSIPTVMEKLQNGDWENFTNKIEGRYLMVLISLLHELDVDLACKEVARLLVNKPHKLHRHTLEAAQSLLHDLTGKFECRGIPFAISSEIANFPLVRAKLEKWIKIIPQEDLAHLTRFDIIAHNPKFDYLGQYNLLFSGIVLVWPAPQTNLLGRWTYDLIAEMTFYHEIGHHACGHLEGGQVEEQEAEANKYSGRFIRKTRPVLYTMLLPFIAVKRLRQSYLSWLLSAPKERL